MTEIDHLERRLAAALARIGAALGRMPDPRAGPDPEVVALRVEVEALRQRASDLELERDDLAQRLAESAQMLAEESVVARQHEARNQALKEKVAALDAALAEARAAGETHEGLIAQLRGVNEKLRENNGALRDANASGLADADLVNGALAAELEAIRASRAADRAELDALLAELRPLAGEDADA